MSNTERKILWALFGMAIFQLTVLLGLLLGFVIWYERARLKLFTFVLLQL